MNAKTIALAAGVALNASGAGACFLEMDIGRGMVTSDPLASPVLVAARNAIDDGHAIPLDMRDKSRMSSAVALQSYLPRVIDGATVKAPQVRFSVLQAQSGYWTRYVIMDGKVHTEAHRLEPGEVEAILVVADSALLPVLIGEASPEDLRRQGLVRARGVDSEKALDAFEALLASFGETRLAQRMRENPRKLWPEG